MRLLNVFRIGHYLFALFIWISISGYAKAQSKPEYSKLIVFGDSLSDTGNLAIFNFPPPYFNNRISDGPVIADRIAAAIGSNADAAGHLLGRSDGFNYAVAGGNIVGDDQEDLTNQVSSYLQRVNSQADPDALYLVFAGGNDLRDLRSTVSAQAAATEIDLIVATLKAQLSRLQAAGARAFLIPNVANIGHLPETLERESEQPGITQRAEDYTRAYNTDLATMVNQFAAARDRSVSAFNFFERVENLIENAAMFGFTNTTEGCFDTDDRTIATECLIFGFERRIFFDDLHPSSASHQIIANQMLSELPDLPMPVEFNAGRTLPAILLLLAD